MIFRLLWTAIQGLSGKPDRGGTQTSKLVAIVCLAVVAGFVVFGIVWPEAARAVLTMLRFSRHIH